MNYALYSALLTFFFLRSLAAGSYTSWQADQAYRAGDLDKARALYEDAVSKSPQDMQALYNVGKVAYKQKDYGTAQKAFTQVSTAPQTSALLKEQALFNNGDAQLMQKNLDEALATYEQVLLINPDNSHAKERIELIKKLKDQQKNEQKNPDQNKKDKNDQNQDKNQDKQDQEQKDSDEQDKDQESEKSKDQKNKDQSDQKDDSQSNDQKKDQSSQDQKEGNGSEKREQEDQKSSEGGSKRLTR